MVDYAVDLFKAWGYAVDVQDFDTAGMASQRYATLSVDAPTEYELLATSMFGSPGNTVRGQLIDVGTGQPEDFPADASGMIVLVQRQDVPFVDMATRALEAGALGMVVANREAGSFPGVIEPPVDILALTVSQSEGAELRDLLAAGQVEVTLSVRVSSIAHNVIARPITGEPCRTFNGGHPDSVPWAPGANDNGSGAAIVLDLARAASVAGLEGHCFVLWGGEEGGLQGSRHLVSQLTPAEIDALEGVFNYDAAAGPGGPLLIGATELSDVAVTLASELGIEVVVTVLPENASSDHASFLEEDISALMLTAPDAGTLHTPNDTFANLIPTSLQPIADLGFALLESFGTP